MKKSSTKSPITFIVSLILFSIIINFGCKTSDETEKPQGSFSVLALSGQVIWEPIFNRTSIYFSVSIKSNNNVGGEITSWLFTIKKDNTTLWTINNLNYQAFNFSVFPSTNSYRIPANQTLQFKVEHGTDVYVSGNPFGNIIPNKLDFSVSIKDNNGYDFSQSTTSNDFTFYEVWEY
jgi:hypothetical protein